MRENMRKLHLIRAEGFQTRLEINISERGMSIQTQSDILQITTTVIYSKRSSTLEMQCITFRENSQSCPIFCYWDSSITLKLLLKRACLATGNLLQCLFPSKHISGNTRGHVIGLHAMFHYVIQAMSGYGSPNPRILGCESTQCFSMNWTEIGALFPSRIRGL